MILLEKILSEILEVNRKYVDKGKVADYIPALAKAKADHIGIGMVDGEGKIDLVGDVDVKFTLQSISKVFTFIMAIEEKGIDYVLSKLDVEGTEEPFNTMYKLDFSNTTKPVNPMVNAGAILTTSLIDRENRIENILKFIRTISKNEAINYNEEVYLSESSTGDKNKSMAYLMKARQILDGEVEEVLDDYFKQCSIEVDLKDLLNMGEFLLNKGRVNGVQIVSEETVKIAVGVMNTAGMYNFSGKYGILVGMPSKSGVSGGILAISPNKKAVVTYSPALDENGNSLVGVNIMKDISKQLNLSIY